MMHAINYPAVVHVPHYEVLVRDQRGWPQETNQLLYRELSDAEWALEHVPLPGEVGARIVKYDVAYYARCGVCGEFVEPEPDEWIYPDWLGLVQCIAASPGWRCTSEQLVFCPNHRPEKEE